MASPQKLVCQRKRRHLHKSKGLCVHCRDLAIPGKTMCAKHLSAHNKSATAHKIKRVKEGRCWICGRPRIIEGLGVDKLQCPSCQDHRLNMRRY